MRLVLSFLYFFLLIIFLSSCSSDSTVSSDTTDTTPRLSIAQAPSNVPISITQTLELVFTSELDPATIDTTTILLIDSSLANVEIDVALVSPANTRLVITPLKYLSPSATYTLVITTGIKNTLGQTLKEDFELTFTTQNDTVVSTPLTIIAMNPASGSITVDTNATLFVQFSSDITPFYTNSPIILKNDEGIELPATYSIKGSVIKIVPTNPLPADFSLNIENTIDDLYGNVYSGTTAFNFSTGADLVNESNYNGAYESQSLGVGNYKVRLMNFEDTNTNVSMEALVVAKDNILSITGLENGAFGWDEFTKTLPSNISDIDMMDEYIAVATVSSGMSIFKLETEVYDECLDWVDYGYDDYDDANGEAYNCADNYEMDNGEAYLDMYITAITSVDTLVSSEYIYGISWMKPTSKLYAVGALYGVKSFDLNKANSTLTLANSDATLTTANIPLDVVASPETNTTYVTDYKNGLRYYDENLTLLSNTPLIGNTRHVYINRDDSGLDTLLVTNTLGIVSSLALDASLTSLRYFDAPSKVLDIAFDPNVTTLYAVEDNNVIVETETGPTYKRLDVLKGVVSLAHTEYIAADGSTMYVLITIDGEGELNVFGW